MTYRATPSLRVPSSGMGVVSSYYAGSKPSSTSTDSVLEKMKKAGKAFDAMPVAFDGSRLCVPDEVYAPRWLKTGDAWKDTRKNEGGRTSSYGQIAEYAGLAYEDMNLLCSCVKGVRSSWPRGDQDGRTSINDRTGLNDPRGNCFAGRGTMSDSVCGARISAEAGRPNTQKRVDWCWTKYLQNTNSYEAWTHSPGMPQSVKNEVPKRLAAHVRVRNFPNPCKPTLHIPAPCSKLNLLTSANIRNRGHENISLHIQREPKRINWLTSRYVIKDPASHLLQAYGGGRRFIPGKDYSPSDPRVDNNALRALNAAREKARLTTPVSGNALFSQPYAGVGSIYGGKGSPEIAKKSKMGLAIIGASAATLFGVVYLLTRKK